MSWTPFSTVLTRAVESGLVGAALVDRNGTTICAAGEIAHEEAMPLAALVMFRLKGEDLTERLFAGEIMSVSIDERDAAVGIAKRQLFVVALLGEVTPARLQLVRTLRDGIARMLATEGDEIGEVIPLPWNDDGPAELPLDFGITVRRGQA